MMSQATGAVFLRSSYQNWQDARNSILCSFTRPQSGNMRLRSLRRDTLHRTLRGIVLGGNRRVGSPRSVRLCIGERVAWTEVNGCTEPSADLRQARARATVCGGCRFPHPGPCNRPMGHVGHSQAAALMAGATGTASPGPYDATRLRRSAALLARLTRTPTYPRNPPASLRPARRRRRCSRPAAPPSPQAGPTGRPAAGAAGAEATLSSHCAVRGGYVRPRGTLGDPQAGWRMACSCRPAGTR